MSSKDIPLEPLYSIEDTDGESVPGIDTGAGYDHQDENVHTAPKKEYPMLLSESDIATNVPLRLDRIPWSRWHWIVVIALGVSWVLDGFEVTIVGVISGVLQDKRTLGLSQSQIGAAGSIYIFGCIIGSIVFGFLADKFGRQKLFIVTPCIYLTATALTGFTWNFGSYAFCQFVKGLGIGGEYSAMNSAINELIPARVRGFVDLAVNGSYWIGAVLASSLSIPLLDTSNFSIDFGWRLPFAVGGILGIFIIISRLMFIPESPRWLIIHNRVSEAERIVDMIERKSGMNALYAPITDTIIISKNTGTFAEVLRSMMNRKYLRRSVVGCSLMISQAFFYNAVFFGYALILTNFYHVASSDVGLYLIPFAIGNFLGGITIGRYFDTIGRRKMIFATYVTSGFLLMLTAILFEAGMLNAVTQTMCWSAVFFVASAAASSAYLTISEVFPAEIRALAISIFYSIGTGVGGLIGPYLFGVLIETSSRANLAGGYFLGAWLMIVAAIIAFVWGVDAEGKSLEEIANAEH